MLKGLNKKGQFYLVAAVIIAAVIIGLAVISNYSRTESNIRVYDLREEIQTENRNVLDYGLNRGSSDLEYYNLMIDFTKNYTSYQPDKNIYFIFGSNTNMTISGNQKENKTVTLNSQQITNQAGEFTGSVAPGAGNITLGIDNLNYNFPINQYGRNFYFVLSQETKGGEYIVSG